MKLNCPSCGARYTPGDNFCEVCGNVYLSEGDFLAQVWCPNGCRVMDPTARVCPSCGARIVRHVMAGTDPDTRPAQAQAAAAPASERPPAFRPAANYRTPLMSEAPASRYSTPKSSPAEPAPAPAVSRYGVTERPPVNRYGMVEAAPAPRYSASPSSKSAPAAFVPVFAPGDTLSAVPPEGTHAPAAAVPEVPAVSPDMVYCPNGCTDFNRNDLFCCSCGARLMRPTLPTAPSSPEAGLPEFMRPLTDSDMRK